MTWDNRLTFEVLSDVRNANPYFETNASGWTGKGGSLVRSTAQFHEGVASGLLTPTGVAATTEAESNSVPVVPLAPYRLTAWVQCAVARNIALNINWFSASAYLSTSSATPVAVAAGVWTQLSFTATAPGTAATATGLVSMTGTPPVGHTLNFDEAILTNADDSGGQWNNLTTRIRDLIQPVTTSVGRQNDLNQSEPGRLDLLLDNSDDALTYGNTVSPYALWWGPGRKCRLRELVNGVTTTRFTGYLQVPTESLITAGIEQRVSITAMDRLGRLASAQPFVSTLAAHIVGSGNGALLAYWSLGEVAPHRDYFGGPTLFESVVRTSASTGGGQPTVAPSSTPQIPADDLSPLRLTPAGDTTATASTRLQADWPSGTLNLAAGQVATAVCWTNLPLTFDDQNTVISLGTIDGFVDTARRTSIDVNNPSGWRTTKPVGTLTGSVNGGVVGSGRWYMIGVRVGFTPNVLELWVDGDVYTGTLTGVLGGPLGITSLSTGTLAGSVAHLQLYIGSPSAWTRTDFLAQRQVGLTGLERQTTGDRIRTIAQYAGVPAAELTQVDKGQSVMQPARLAGKDPLTAMRDAERTEQGLLYADGSGNLVFEDRNSLYNI